MYYGTLFGASHNRLRLNTWDPKGQDVKTRNAIICQY